MTYQQVSELGVHIAGGFPNPYPVWDPEGIALSDDDGDNIYQTTLTLQPGGSHDYKFINGNAWGMDESVQRNINVPQSLIRLLICIGTKVDL